MKKLAVFDFDDTLVSSDAKIKLYDQKRKRWGELTPSQFNHHHINQSKYFYDFSEFNNAEILSKSRILDTFQILKDHINNNQDVCVLTARDSHPLIYNFLTSIGIKISPEMVIVVGGDPTMTVPEKKKQSLSELISKGYDDITIYDDNINNLRAMKQLTNDSVKIKTIHVA